MQSHDFTLPLARLAAPALAVALSFALTGCAGVPGASVEKPLPPPIPVAIMGQGLMPSDRLSAFLVAGNPAVDPAKARRLAAYYVESAALEGVNADVAFAQMCLETGFLRFGGLVTEDMNNFCGLGSIGPEQPGNSFPDESSGVAAHVQHLKAYASSEPLVGTPIDPRYRYVNPKGKAPTIHGLAGTWAADKAYGVKLEDLLTRLYSGT